MKYYYYDSIDSTNNELRRRLDSDTIPEEFTVISAARQTKGRGRTGHIWESGQDASIATSILLYPKELPDEAVAQITLPAAVAVCRALKEVCGIDAQIKWPNDVLFDFKKMCGILTERIGHSVIVGIGLNVLKNSYPDSLKDSAISIEEILHKDFFDSNISERLTKKIWEDFLELYDKLLHEKNLSFLQDEYQNRLIGTGKNILIIEPEKSFEARACGIDSFGKLIVETEDGQILAIDSGEVHVRGVDGYI